MAEVGTRAGYPQVTIPAGYDPTARRPQAISFTGTAGDDAKLLGFGYAFERAALVRRTPSEVMPQTWHCVAPIVYIPRRCGPGELAPPTVRRRRHRAGAGRRHRARRRCRSPSALRRRSARSRRASRRSTRRATTANVISTALDATLTVSDPGHLMNGTFALPEPLQVDALEVDLDGAGVQRPGDDRLQAAVKATDALRTGAYSKTLTFTLSTTTP